MWTLFFDFHLPFLFLSLLFPPPPAIPCPSPPGAALHAEAHDEDGGGHPAQQVDVLQGHRGQGHPPSVVLRLTTAFPQLPLKGGIPPFLSKAEKGRSDACVLGKALRKGLCLLFLPASLLVEQLLSFMPMFHFAHACNYASIPYITASLEPCFEDICLTAMTIHSSAQPLLAPVTTRVSAGAVVTSSYLGGGASAAAAAAANASSEEGGSEEEGAGEGGRAAAGGGSLTVSGAMMPGSGGGGAVALTAALPLLPPFCPLLPRLTR